MMNPKIRNAIIELYVMRKRYYDKQLYLANICDFDRNNTDVDWEYIDEGFEKDLDEYLESGVDNTPDDINIDNVNRQAALEFSYQMRA